MADEWDVEVVIKANGIPIDGLADLADTFEKVWPGGEWFLTDTKKVGEFRFVRTTKGRKP